MLKKARLSGRRLFFAYVEARQTYLIFLLDYKKESDEAPAHLIAAARERMGRFVESRRRL